jgi:hypothetical protein
MAQGHQSRRGRVHGWCSTLAAHYQSVWLLFEMLLDEWYRDPELWPEDRTNELFDEWFEASRYTGVVDLVLERITFSSNLSRPLPGETRAIEFSRIQRAPCRRRTRPGSR